MEAAAARLLANADRRLPLAGARLQRFHAKPAARRDRQLDVALDLRR